MTNHRWIPLVILMALALVSLFLGEQPQTRTGNPIDLGDTAWLLTATGLVLLMTPGLSFFYAGMVSTKNVISTMLQSFIALGVISLLWVVVGFSLCFGDSYRRAHRRSAHLLHVPRRRRGDRSRTWRRRFRSSLFAMFQLKFAVITPALITGSFAERVRFSAYLRVHGAVLARSSTARWRTGPGIRRASCGSGASSISPAAPSCTCRRASPRSPARSCSAGAEVTRTAASTRPRTFPTCCSARACCGSAGLASTPDRRLSANATAAMAFATTHIGVGVGDAGVDSPRRGARPASVSARRLHRLGRRPGGHHAGGRLS